MSGIKVDKDIPIPMPRVKYPWGNLDVGDSFFVRKPPGGQINKPQSLQRAGRKYTIRTVDGGFRIWRIK